MTDAHDAIGKALEDWISGLPKEEEGEDPGILGDWVAAVAMVDVDDEGHPRVEYYLCMRDGNMLPHVAVGLLHEGLDMVDRNRISGSDDD